MTRRVPVPSPTTAASERLPRIVSTDVTVAVALVLRRNRSSITVAIPFSYSPELALGVLTRRRSVSVSATSETAGSSVVWTWRSRGLRHWNIALSDKRAGQREYLLERHERVEELQSKLRGELVRT